MLALNEFGIPHLMTSIIMPFKRELSVTCICFLVGFWLLCLVFNIYS